MEQLARLKARLTTLTELGDIIVAMRALAAAVLQEGRQALPAVSRYARLIEDGIGDVAAILDATAEQPPGDDTVEAETFCIIGSEHGFVGDLNAELLAGVDLPRASRLIVVGGRLQGAATERDLPIAAALPMTTHVAGVPLLARKIAECVGVGVAARVRLVTVQHEASTVGVSAQERQVLPVPLPAPGARSSPPPLHQIKAQELLAELAGEYLLAEISRALIEGLIEENQIRLGVLNAASKNISDKLEELRRKERTLRQETITTELLDVVVGALAVTETEGH